MGLGQDEARLAAPQPELPAELRTVTALAVHLAVEGLQLTLLRSRLPAVEQLESYAGRGHDSLAEQAAGQPPGRLDRAGLVTFAQHVEHHMVGAGLPVPADPRGDRVGVAPDHQLVDECVTEAGDVAVGESHPG